MKPAELLSEHVRQALQSGQDRTAISTSLAAAGWSANEISEALSAWADGPSGIPVPRPRPYVSAQDAFFYALMFSALAMTSWNLTSLGFSIINRVWPTMPDSYYSLSDMRFALAAVIVFFPFFGLMQRHEWKLLAADPSKKRSTIRKWFGYLALFLSAIALLGDVMTAIYTFLNGAATFQFTAKVLLVAVIAGTIFAYFRAAMAEVDHAK